MTEKETTVEICRMASKLFEAGKTEEYLRGIIRRQSDELGELNNEKLDHRARIGILEDTEDALRDRISVLESQLATQTNLAVKAYREVVMQVRLTLAAEDKLSKIRDFMKGNG